MSETPQVEISVHESHHVFAGTEAQNHISNKRIIRKITQLHRRGIARNVGTSLCDVSNAWLLLIRAKGYST